MKSDDGIDTTRPSVPSMLQTSSPVRAGLFVAPPTHVRRIGSLSCRLVGSTSAPSAPDDGSGLSPQVPGGGRRWTPSLAVVSGTPPGPIHCLWVPRAQFAFDPLLSQLSALQYGLVPK